MMWIKLTDCFGGKPVYINTEMLCSVVNHEKGSCATSLSGGLLVRESPETIMRMIEEKRHEQH